MPEQQRYDQVVRCLETYGYEVTPDPPGYFVSLHGNPTDVS